MIRLTYAVTHLGEKLGLAPTGKAISYGVIAVFRISADRVVDGWVMGGRLGLFKQVSGPVASNTSA